ncbi:MAG: sigma-70 family RNA polymerase sigma factor, partial [Candidatus Eremiobacteraeota bacterium]|nr:sigma-70 family RNA polymerase sigma factor [Candidatus Eremiobacteraeota bacterium]
MRGESLEDGFARRGAAAYEAAYRQYAARMYATALRLLRDRELAAECVHDVFLHLWQRRGAYVAARGSLEAFLVACVRNRALTELRAGSRRESATSKLEAVHSYDLEEDPIERERIARAVAQLSEAQAAVVRLAYFRGMTLTEVAAALAIPIGTVKGR